MKDNEIVKSLEICANNGDCKDCRINPHKGNYGYCTSLAIKSALNLINRQKAEIAEYQKHIDNDIIYVKSVKAEAIKEFAGKVNEKINHYYDQQRDIDQDDEVADAVRDYLSYLTMDVESILDELTKEAEE